MKKLTILTSILVLAACSSGGGHHSGNVAVVPDDFGPVVTPDNGGTESADGDVVVTPDNGGTESAGGDDVVVTPDEIIAESFGASVQMAAMDSDTFTNNIANLDSSLLGDVDVSTLNAEQKDNLAKEVTAKIATLEEKYAAFVKAETSGASSESAGSIPVSSAFASVKRGGSVRADAADVVLTLDEMKQILKLNQIAFESEITMDDAKDKLLGNQERIEKKFVILQNVMKPASLYDDGMKEIVDTDEPTYAKLGGNITVKDNVLKITKLTDVDMKYDENDQPVKDENGNYVLETEYEEFAINLDQLKNGSGTIKFETTDDDEQYYYDDKGNRVVYEKTEGTVSGDLTINMYGKLAGLKYSEFGNVVLDGRSFGTITDQDGTRPYDQKEYGGLVFAYGYDNKEVSKFEMGDQTFTGKAVARQEVEIEEVHFGEMENGNTYWIMKNINEDDGRMYDGDAKLVFKAGEKPTETLTASLTNIKDSSDKYDVEFEMGNDNPLLITNAAGETSELMGTGNVKYFAENPLSGVAEEAAGTVYGWKGEHSGDWANGQPQEGDTYTRTQWDIAFGVKNQ